MWESGTHVHVQMPTHDMRDAWGRIVALNDGKYNPNPTPPPADGFGQLRG